jgi:hypothetical protein
VRSEHQRTPAGIRARGRHERAHEPRSEPTTRRARLALEMPSPRFGTDLSLPKTGPTHRCDAIMHVPAPVWR